MIFDKETFGKYKLGTVVARSYPIGSEAMVGHIVGFASNGQEVILSVQWAGCTGPLCVHPANVEVLE